jgi:hypothetical protein
VPKHLRGKPADCLAVLLQAKRWGDMDPFAVAQKTYFVNDGMGYEAQLVNAIICSRAPIKARPDYRWSGEGDKRRCEVSCTFIGEDKPKVFEAKMETITTKNSPLWKQQPDQQLAYFALRAWARIHCPDILLGVYTPEERREMIDVTPPDSQSAASTIENELRQEAAREKGQPAKVTDVVDETTGEVITRPALQDMLDDIASAPTAEGVDFKASAALEAYGTDANASAAISLAKTERKRKLAAKSAPSTPSGQQPDPSAAGNSDAKGFFKRVSEKAAEEGGQP